MALNSLHIATAGLLLGSSLALATSGFLQPIPTVIVAPEPIPKVQVKPASSSGGGYNKYPISTYIEIDKKEVLLKNNIDLEKILREDEEIISIIVAVVESGLI